jgi:hypothetical protein
MSDSFLAPKVARRKGLNVLGFQVVESCQEWRSRIDCRMRSIPPERAFWKECHRSFESFLRNRRNENMKLRIQDNSIRFRLSQSEVAQLAQGLRIEQTTVFSPESKLTCEILPGPSATVSAGFADDRITVSLPKHEIAQWATTQVVGIEGKQETVRGQFLEILIEKDFECLHSKTPKDADAFPNPKR